MWNICVLSPLYLHNYKALFLHAVLDDFRMFEDEMDENYGLISKEILPMKIHANSKGQIVIPASLRRKYGIKEGTKIIITDTGDSIVLKPITGQYLKKLQGSLKGKGGLKILLHERFIESQRNR